ncbi:MAG: hypothetical protein ACYDCK_02855 [Thermoplasmatota archaeon]
MMLTTSLLATAALGLIASQWHPFTRRDWALAVSFAVLVDADHLANIPSYLASHHGAAGFDALTMLHWGMAWQGALHTWWALAIVIPVAVFMRTWIPVGFWGLHMVLDFDVATRHIVWGSLEEWAFDAALLLVVVALLAWDHRRHGHGATFGEHAARLLGISEG